jgi:hypothetical protein
MRRVESGESVEAISADTGFRPARILRFVEEEHDRRQLTEVDVSGVSTTVMRELFEDWHAKNPSRHTYLELARLAGLDSASTVQRLLGLIPNARVVKENRVYEGKVRTKISTEMGGRLARAMGHVPAEIEGL